MYDYNANSYNKITNQNRNYINDIHENNNLYNKDNLLSHNSYTNSMLPPNINQNIFNTQNYHLLSSYPNNLNYKYINNTPFNTQNSNQDGCQYNPNNEVINNENNLFRNISISPNDKNISVNSQISQEIDRQKIKFDEMVEKVKNNNNSELFEFDIKKYLPKDNFETTKTFRKYKDLIKPINNTNRNNYIGKKNNEFKDNYIRDNSLSEIPIRNDKNDNLFEDELSNFNLENKEINIINYNNIEKDKNDFELKSREQLKQNLLNNIDDLNLKENENIEINNKNFKENNLSNINAEENPNLEKLNQAVNNSINDIDINLKDEINTENIIKKPYYGVYYEKYSIENNEEINFKDEENMDENFDEVEKLNSELIKNYNNLNNINDYVWHCLDFNEEKPDIIFNEFFNNDNI